MILSTYTVLKCSFAITDSSRIDVVDIVYSDYKYCSVDTDRDQQQGKYRFSAKAHNI